MTLRELIARLEALDPTMVVRPAFGGGDSWRGSYDEVAFTPLSESTVGAMLAEARRMVGATLHGYKGGEYEATLDTPCNVAAWGVYGGDSDRMDVWWATTFESNALRARVAALEGERDNLKRAYDVDSRLLADLRAQLAAAQAELERMEVRLIGAGAAQADLAEAARHVRSLVDEWPDCRVLPDFVQAAEAWLAARGGER